jgi:diguanylate cyclase (GGDEF)-like protein/PAS domain S-box-containing protein
MLTDPPNTPIPRLSAVRKWAVLTIFGVSVALSLYLYSWVQRVGQAQAHARLEERAQLSVHAIQYGIEHSVTAIGSLHELFVTHPNAANAALSEGTFAAFAHGLRQRHPELRALEWIPRVTHAERGPFERAARAAADPNFSITQRGPTGAIEPAAQRAEYFPVRFVEPRTGNQAAIGFDLASDPLRRSALIRARDRGEMVTTEGIHLVQDAGDQTGFLMLQPVYAHGRPQTPQARRTHLLGYVLGVFHVDDLIRSRLASINSQGLMFRIDEASGPSEPARRLYETHPGVDHSTTEPISRTALTLPNRHWWLEARAHKLHHEISHSAHPWIVLSVGLLFSLITAFYLLGILRRSTYIEMLLIKQALAQEYLRLAASVLKATDQAMMITTADAHITEVNPAFTHTTGYSREEALGRTPTLLKSGRHARSYYQNMWDTLLRTGTWQGEIWNRRKTGEIYPQWFSIVAILNHAQETTHYAGMFSDISTQVHTRERLHSLAYYDVLTGLPNRALFQDRLENALRSARRTQTMLALFFLDLDRFKTINDTLGHSAGDALLKRVTERLTELLRESDTIARLGGDEFTLIAPISAGPEAAFVVAEKLVACFAEPFQINGQELFVTTSIGISLFPKDGDDLETLIQNADTAMYRAKDAGRNTYQFYQQAMSAQFEERLRLENALRRAIERDEFRLVYQPKVQLSTGQIVGVEALIRWLHPTQGEIPPLTFIAVAEEAGLMDPIGHWVLTEACEQAHRWQEAGMPLQVSVNLSAQQVKPGFVTEVQALIHRLGLPARYLELEITESLMMGDVALSVEVISALSDMGVDISVDDFGTGYSSLSYLQRFSITKLKIDKSFVDKITTDAGDAQIATTIIAMAHHLNLTVIAEGVETQAQLDFLKRLGCDQVQGYYLHRPMPADEIAERFAASAP